MEGGLTPRLPLPCRRPYAPLRPVLLLLRASPPSHARAMRDDSEVVDCQVRFKRSAKSPREKVGGVGRDIVVSDRMSSESEKGVEGRRLRRADGQAVAEAELTSSQFLRVVLSCRVNTFFPDHLNPNQTSLTIK